MSFVAVMIPSIPSPPASHSQICRLGHFHVLRRRDRQWQCLSYVTPVKSQIEIRKDKPKICEKYHPVSWTKQWPSLSLLSLPRPRIPDCIATVDENWHVLDKWNQKIIAQEDWKRVQRAQVQGEEWFNDHVNCQGTFTRKRKKQNRPQVCCCASTTL